MAVPLATVDESGSRRQILDQAPLLVGGLIFLWLFWEPFVTLLRDWWSDPEAGHGLLLGPLSVYLMYRSGLVPRRMALLGLIGGPLAFIGGVLVLFDVLKPMSAGLIALTVVEVVWELSITIYPLVKGFRPFPAV